MRNNKCIDATAARHFITHYQNLLEEIPVPAAKQQAGVVLRLQAARDAMLAQPELQSAALQRLHEQGRGCADDVLQAVRTLRVDRWVYVRDTSGHSLLLQAREAAGAYVVKTLTTPLKDMFGASGAVITCGLLVYQGQVISDGLVGFIAWLGPNYRRSFSEQVAQYRAQGRLYSDRILPA